LWRFGTRQKIAKVRKIQQSDDKQIFHNRRNHKKTAKDGATSSFCSFPGIQLDICFCISCVATSSAEIDSIVAYVELAV